MYLQLIVIRIMIEINNYFILMGITINLIYL